MLNSLTQKYKIVLGSNSPRRQQFLKDLELPFKTLSIVCEETYVNKLQAKEITEFLCQKKSNTVNLGENELLITADTIVWCNQKALEKPKDAIQAIDMLNELSNNCNEVITSICLRTLKKTEVITEKTKVFFNALTQEEIKFYVERYKPFDKAGSYGIQEWIGMIGVSKIEGSYTNVVGLPTEKLYNALKKF